MNLLYKNSYFYAIPACINKDGRKLLSTPVLKAENKASEIGRLVLEALEVDNGAFLSPALDFLRLEFDVRSDRDIYKEGYLFSISKLPENTIAIIPSKKTGYGYSGIGNLRRNIISDNPEEIGNLIKEMIKITPPIN